MRSAHILVALLVVTLLGTTLAFPFSKDSGVVELNPASMKNFLATTKPVFIVFYAPWCGHCKSIHPEWEKFAKGLKNLVRIGAVNADQHKDIGSTFGIQGFPTIKYWGAGEKKGMKPTDYQGERKAKNMHNMAVSLISTKNVHKVVDLAMLTTKFDKVNPSSGKGVVLFTNKAQTPPMFNGLSSSAELQKLGFFVVDGSKAAALSSSFDVAKLPSIVVVEKDSEGALVKAADYTGNMEYMAIATYLKGLVSGGDGASSAEGEKAAGSEGTEEKVSEKKEPVKPSAPKPALPVRPVALSAKGLQSYCGQGSLKIRQQQPLCVISFRKGASMDALHKKLEDSGPFLFLDGSSADSGNYKSYQEQWSTYLEGSGYDVNEGDVVLLRAFRQSSAKVLVLSAATDESIEEALIRFTSGELTWKTMDTFPQLVEGSA